MLERGQLGAKRLEQWQQRGRNERDLRAAVSQHVLVVAARQQRVDRDRHDAGLDRPQESGRKIDRVVQAQQDALLRLHAEATKHVREGIETDLTVDELREFWKPISPVPFIPRLLDMKPRPIRFIAARYDLTFPVDLSRQVITEVKALGIDLDVVWLPCGHYTTAELPWKAIDAWKIATFFRKYL